MTADEFDRIATVVVVAAVSLVLAFVAACRLGRWFKRRGAPSSACQECAERARTDAQFTALIDAVWAPKRGRERQR